MRSILPLTPLSVALVAFASLLIGASGFYAVSSHLQNHGTSKSHSAQLMPYYGVPAPQTQTASAGSAG
jgi:hypothetical protein